MVIDKTSQCTKKFRYCHTLPDTQLYYTNAEVNEKSFARLSRPVKKIGAQHKGHDAHKAAEDEADNLAPSLHLCIGARVVLTTSDRRTDLAIEAHRPFPRLYIL